MGPWKSTVNVGNINTASHYKKKILADEKGPNKGTQVVVYTIIQLEEHPTGLKTYLIIMADPDNLADVGWVAGALHLRGQEVREALGGEAVHIVDGVALPGQRIDKHTRSCSHSRLGNLKINSILEAA